MSGQLPPQPWAGSAPQGGVQLPEHARQALAKRWEPKPQYDRDPVKWAHTRLPGTYLWSKQREIMESVRDNPQTAVQSCHSAGKSFIAATIACWWLDSHPAGEAFVVSTAPTGDQVKAILWREINRAHKRGALPGRTNLTEWYLDGELVGMGRKPNEYDEAAFQGIHARFVLVILDEACGIPKELWEAGSSIASNINSRILAIGNPDDPQSHFAGVCASPMWHTIKVSAFDTPNFTHEPVPEILNEMLVAEEWVERKRIEWGERSPLWIAKVKGEFPQDADDGVIPFSWIQRARLTEHAPEGDVEAGLDVSAGGTDRTVLWIRCGPRAIRRYDWRGYNDPAELSTLVSAVLLEHEVSVVKVDTIGVGWGVAGLLDVARDHGEHTAAVMGVKVSESPDDSSQFLNKRAEIWWRAREASRLGEWDLTALDDDDVDELTAVRYHTSNPKGKIQVESKDELKKRLKKSPDSADALLLAFHVPFAGFEDFTDLVVQTRLGVS